MPLFTKKPPARTNDLPSNNPLSRVLALLLEQAVESGADEIFFGVPPDGPATWSEVAAEQRARRDATPIPSTTPAYSAAITKSATLKCAMGAVEIPIWMRVEGVYYSLLGPPASSFTGMLLAFDDLLVSINGSEEMPQPRRYIELSQADMQRRRFIEVEMVMAEDNSIRILLHGIREEGTSARVSRHYH